MARSFIDPSLVALALEPSAPPWNWNPGATFVEAFNESRRTKMMQEKQQMEQEMERILFPLKVQKAQIELEKLVQDRDRTMLYNEQLRQGRRVANQGIMSAMTNPTQKSSYNSSVRIGKDGTITPSMIQNSEPDLPEILPGDILEEF